jgi:hypothetical protein
MACLIISEDVDDEFNNYILVKDAIWVSINTLPDNIRSLDDESREKLFSMKICHFYCKHNPNIIRWYIKSFDSNLTSQFLKEAHNLGCKLTKHQLEKITCI